MSESEIALALANYGDHQRRYDLMIPNAYITHDSEADLFCVRKSGLCDEFEIKTSRADFLADKKKFIKWRELNINEYGTFNWCDRRKQSSYKPKYDALVDGDLCVNYFWFVVLEGIAQRTDIPEFAGLIVVNAANRIKIEKQPKRLHSNKLSLEDRYKFARKSSYRYWALRNKI